MTRLMTSICAALMIVATPALAGHGHGYGHDKHAYKHMQKQQKHWAKHQKRHGSYHHGGPVVHQYYHAPVRPRVVEYHHYPASRVMHHHYVETVIYPQPYAPPPGVHVVLPNIYIPLR
jgi:hypothetical protein